ncbi:hypothetical protein AAC387_Pa03g1692 [Persea americana]
MTCSSLLFFFFILILSSLPKPSHPQQILTSFNISNSPWRPSQQRVLSSLNSTFAAGFRSLSTSPNAYIFAVWFQNDNDKTVVWSINRNSPVGPMSPLVVTASGSLFLNDSTGENLWQGATNGSRLVLGEDGNLVFGNWESFNSPTDTFLPTQNMSSNGNSLVLKSRKDLGSYAEGRFEFTEGNSLIFNSTDVYWSSDYTLEILTSEGVIKESNGNTRISADVGDIRLRRLTLDIDGNLRVYSLQSSGSWVMVWQAIQELCQIHGSCGPNFVCTSNGSNTTRCICPPGFQTTNDGACERKIKLREDPKESKFLRLDYVNFTGGANQTDLKARNFNECQSWCRNNFRCLGFAVKFDGKRYCVHQIDRLLYGYWSPGSEVAMFLRVDLEEKDQSNFTGMNSMLETVCPVKISLPLPPKESKAEKRNLAIICSLFAIELIIGVLSFWAFLRKYSKYRDMARTFGLEFLPAGGPKRFSYAELRAATKDFSNVVGQGGFGVVYRGELPDHRIIAVKRLKNVGGGEADFWVEVTIIARMHHLNLVRMWGFCAEKGQRMLVYEYIPNGSLDKYLFQPNNSRSEEGDVKEEEEEENSMSLNDRRRQNANRPVLDWNIRYRIAVGVARAIAYLHEECLEWVLHCDIKPENILLEDDFCPKVSDFGLAKLANKKDKVSMSRMRGTRGYMAPEWVKPEEPITAKADVYSFGMVLLEIVSGVRNTNFRQSSMDSDEWYYPRWAFEKVYTERKVEEILDRHILDNYDDRIHFPMVDRMVKTAMWCLQDRPETRPSMGKVAKMLEGTVEITEPGKPTIFYLKEN